MSDEVNAMRTAVAHLRKVVVVEILAPVMEVGYPRSYARLSLDSGLAQALEPALALISHARFCHRQRVPRLVEEPVQSVPAPRACG